MEKLIDKVLTILAILAGLLLLFITFSVSYTIFARFLGFAGMISVVQFTEYSLLWITLLGSAWVLKKDKHVSVDLLTGRMGPRTRVYLNLVHSVMGMAVCGVLCLYGIMVTWGQYQRGVQDIQVIDMPKYLILIIIPVGFFILTLQFLRKFIESLKEFRVRHNHAALGNTPPGHRKPGATEGITEEGKV